MTTANDMVNSALEEILRLPAGETPPAEDAAIALKALNKMLHGWELEYGIDLGHSDLALTDTITLPDSHIHTVEMSLAVSLGPKFSATPRAETISFAERGLRALQAVYSQVPELKFDRGLQSRVRTSGGTERFSG